MKPSEFRPDVEMHHDFIAGQHVYYAYDHLNHCYLTEKLDSAEAVLDELHALGYKDCEIINLGRFIR